MLNLLLKLILTILLTSILSATAGCLAVFKKNTFMVSGVAHGALAGVALGILVQLNHPDFDPYISAFLFSILIGFIVAILETKGVAGESGVGITFAVSMSFAVLFLSLLREYASRAWNYIVGDPYLLTYEDIAVIAVTTIIVLIILLLSFQKIVFTTFDYQGAMAYGVPVRLYNFVIYALIAVSVVVLLGAVGIIMVYAILILPPAIAKMIGKSVGGTMFLSFIIAMIAGLIALGISYIYSLPLSALTGIILAAIYGGSFLKFRE